MSRATASAATPCSPAASPSAARRCRSTDLDFAARRRRRAARRAAAGLLLAARPRRRRVARERRAARRSARRPLAARPRHARRRRLARRPVGRAHPLLDGLRALHPVERATPAIARPCSTRWRAARATSTPTPTRRRRASTRITAWCGVVAAGLLVQGGVPRVARGEAGLARALAAAQFDDGGLISRSPFEQMLLVDRLGLLRAAISRPSRPCPTAIEAAAAAALAALHGVTMGDGALSSWQGGNPGDAARLHGAGRRLRPARPAAAPGARLGLSAPVGARHGRWCSTPRRRRRRRWPRAAAPRPWRSKCRTARSGWSSIAAGPGRFRPTLPDELVAGLRTTAAHSTLILADTNSTAILADGSLGKGVEDVTIDRSEDNDASRLEASHDGYVRALRPGPQAQPDARQ